MTFSQRIAAIRKEMKLSQEKFGELVNVSQRTVAFWESGDRTPSHIILTDLANTLDCSVDYLLGRSDTRKQEEKPAVSDSELKRSTIERIKSLPEPVLVKLLDLMDAVQSCQEDGSAAPAAPDSLNQSSP